MFNASLNHYLIFALLTLFGCDVTPSLPPDDNPKTTFQWTTDTIYFTNGKEYGQTLISDVKVFNDSTAIAVGHDAWVGLGTMWKYNGKSWSRVNVFIYQGGFEVQAMNLSVLWGSSVDDYYAGGVNVYSNSNPPPNFLEKSIIWHYQNGIWNKISLGVNGRFQCITSSDGKINNLTSGKYLINIETTPTIDSIDIPYLNSQSENYNIRYAFYDDQKKLHTITQYLDSLNIPFYRYITKYNNKWEVVDSLDPITMLAKWGTEGVYISPSQSVFSYGTGGIFRLVNNKWDKIYSADRVVDLVVDSFGKIIAIVNDRDIMRFNGSSWEKIYTNNNPLLTNGKVRFSENSIFLSFHDGIKSYILKGTTNKK